MNTAAILRELEAMSSETTRHTMSKHGAPRSHMGVKVEDLKKIQKKIRKDYSLSLELYDTGVSDAQYLAGLIADEKKMTKENLQHWVENAQWHMQSEYTVPWIAAESAHGWELALQWIDDPRPGVQSSGWSTLASWVALKDDASLDIKKLEALLKRVEKEIHGAANRVRYTMNNFIIALGCYVPALTEKAIAAGRAIGKVEVNMGETACKVPSAPEYINKVKIRGTVGKKRKMARC